MHRFHALLIPSLSAVLCLSLSAGAGTPPPIDLRVVTYNVQNGLGAPGSDQQIAAGSFMTWLDQDGAGPNTGLRPDVVFLQECDQSSFSQLTAFRDAYLPGYSISTAAGDGFNFNATLVRPDITVVTSSSLNVGGPRGVVKTRMRVPGALQDVLVYNAHFKSGGDSSSQNQRRGNANVSGQNVLFEVQFGNPPSNVIFAGDLNSNNNQDGTISGLFNDLSQNPPVPTGMLNLPVESLVNAANPNITSFVTFPSSGSRLDYVCLDAVLADFYDADNNGSFSQTELNSMGFVYFSQDDAGQRSNGNATATSAVSDHRPVVFDVKLPRDPMIPFFAPSDIDQDGALDIEDLHLWESRFAQTAPPQPSPAADVDGNRNVDLADRAVIRTSLRSTELADILAP